MRVIFDTNVLLSALLSAKSPPAQLLGHWRQGRFTLLSCEEQLDEVRRVTRYPKLRERLAPALAGRLVNEVRALSDMIDDLPMVDISPDPWANYLLALAQKGHADFLITGDKNDVLSLKRHAGTAIVTARQMLVTLGLRTISHGTS